MHRKNLLQRAMYAFMALNIAFSPALSALAYEDNEPRCGLEEHTHTDACYIVTPERTEKICAETLDGEVIHTHNEFCFDDFGNIICSLPEVAAHVHDENCYEHTRVLSCELAETDPEHVHTDECYTDETRLICPLPEVDPEIVPTHICSEDCFRVIPAVMSEEPVCGLQEHQHSESCYQAQEPDATEQDDQDAAPGQDPGPSDTPPEPTDTEGSVPEYTCGQEEHTHDETCFDAETGELTCDIDEHIHSESCLSHEPEYFCGMVEHTHDEGCLDTDTGEYLCGLEEHTHTEDCLSPAGPEYLCGLEEHAHGDSCYDDEGSLMCGIQEHIHSNDCLLTDAFRINGTVVGQEYTYTAGNINISVHIEGNAKLPEAGTAFGNIELCVTVLKADDPICVEARDYYESLAEETELWSLTAMQLGFTVDGEPLDISGCTMRVETSITPKENTASQSASAPSADMGMEGPGIEEPGDLQNLSGITESSANTVVSIASLENGEVVEQDSEKQTDGTVMSGFALMSNNGNVIIVAEYGAANPAYLLQHFYTFPEVELKSSGTIPIIDTSKSLPVNGKAPTVEYLDLVKQSDGQWGVKTTDKMVRLFADESTVYKENSDIMQMDRLFNSMETGEYNPNYTLSEVWVGTSDLKESVDRSKFTVYPVESLSDGRHDPNSIGFTNNPNNPYITKVTGHTIGAKNTDPAYPYSYTILISEDCIIRLVFSTTTSEDVTVAETNFFDYDISDGYIYTDKGLKNRRNTSEQNNSTWYTNTNKQGINSASNYSGSGAKYGFGNANSDPGWQNETWVNNGANNSLNVYNRVTGNFKGMTLGLVTGYQKNGDEITPIWNSGISAPDLFGLNQNSCKGKTVYQNDEFTTGFHRRGSTYTMDNIKYNGSIVVPALRDFTRRDFSATNIIYSNDFWPMDFAPSYGTNGHDMKFGSTSISSKRNRIGSSGIAGTLPASDDGLDHNSYFGMTFSVTFRLDPGYVGPLDYLFFGDDDMWVFLDEVNGTTSDAVQIVDIGGVHSSVGEYVDLWQYVDPVPYGGEAKEYTLTYFYTERGASGSTCYLRFTLPLDFDIITEANVTDLRIEKDVTNTPPDKTDVAYDFELAITTASGVSLENLYDFRIYDSVTNKVEQEGSLVPTESELDGVTVLTYHFALKGSQYIIIEGLPTNRTYRVIETAKGDYETHYDQGTYESGSGQRYVTLSAKGDDVTGPATLNYVRFENQYPEPVRLPETGGLGVLPVYACGVIAALPPVSILLRKRDDD